MLARTLTRRAALLSALSWTLEARRLRAEQSMPHVVLLGDSVFDNGAYVGGDPDVVRQVRELLPPGAGAALNARDGAVIADVASQLARLPAGATHLVISVGGNDALLNVGVLEAAAT